MKSPKDCKEYMLNVTVNVSVTCISRKRDRPDGLISVGQKLTTCRPKQWSVTPSIDWQLDRPPPTVGGYRQSSDNWQTLSRARDRPGAERRNRRTLYDLLITAAIVTRTDRKYEFITDHVTPARWRLNGVIDYEEAFAFAVHLVPSDVCPRKSAAMTGCCTAVTWNWENPRTGIIVEITSCICLLFQTTN